MTGRVAHVGSSFASALRSGLNWWVHELAALVPASLRDRRSKRPDAEIRLERTSWIVGDRTGRSATVEPSDGKALGSVLAGARGRRRQGRVTLVVPLSRCFVRRSELPRSLLGQATTILASELESTTPFQPGAVHWDWFVEGAGSQRGTVSVAQIVLKYRDTEAILHRLADNHMNAAALCVEDDTGSPGRRLPVNLFRNDRLDSDEPANLRQARRVLIAAAILAALAIVPAGFSRQSAILSQLDADIADATDAVALRPGLARGALQSFGDALQAKRDWPVTAVLDELAATLPADSHLDHLFLERDVVTIQGRTASIHNLERTLGASRLFTAGHNTAPPATGEGVPFTLRLRIRPVPGSAEG